MEYEDVYYDDDEIESDSFSGGVVVRKVDDEYDCYYDDGGNMVCKEHMDGILRLLGDGAEVPSGSPEGLSMRHVIDSILMFTMTECRLHYKDYVDNIKYIFSKCIIEEKYLVELLGYHEFDECYESLHYSKKINLETSSEVFRQLSYRVTDGDDNGQLMNFIINNVHESKGMLLLLSYCGEETMMNKIIVVIDKYGGNDMDKGLMLLNACQNLPKSKELVIALVNHGAKLTQGHVGVVCDHCDYMQVDFVLELGGLKPTKDHFKMIVKIGHWVHDEGRKFEKYFEVFVKHGFVPTHKDIIHALENKKEIVDIERFGLVCDVHMIKICKEIGFYPKAFFPDVDGNMLKLRELSAVCEVGKMRVLVRESGLVPDKECMKNAYSMKKGEKNVKCLLDAGYKVMIEDILSYARVSGDKIMIELVENYNCGSKAVEVLVSEQEIGEYKNKYLKKQMPHGVLVQLFDIGSKKKIAFGDLKKVLMGYLEKGGCVHAGYINMSKELKGKLGLGNGHVACRDIDKLVVLCYKLCE